MEAENAVMPTSAWKRSLIQKRLMLSFFLFDQWNSTFLLLYEVTDDKSVRRIMLK